MEMNLDVLVMNERLGAYIGCPSISYVDEMHPRVQDEPYPLPYPSLLSKDPVRINRDRIGEESSLKGKLSEPKSRHMSVHMTVRVVW